MKITEMDEFVVDEPGYLVFDLPVSLPVEVFADKTTKAPERVIHPVLAIRSADGDVFFPDEVLAWVRNLVEQEVPTADIRRKLNSVGRFWEFSETTVGANIAEPGVIDMVVWQYLRTRAENPLDPSQRTFTHWQPVRYQTIQNEFRDIFDFAKHCSDYKRDASVIGSAFKSSSIWSTAKRSSPPEDFLMHLGAERARWNEMLGDDEVVARPKSVKKLAVKPNAPKNGNTTSLLPEQIDAIIDRETNVVFRALWILLAFVGPRISEVLNMWTCDVLNPSYARRLFLTDIRGPLVVFADPRASTYTGSFDAERSLLSRTDYLKSRYGLKPRPDAEGKKQRAGWKGMMTFNADLLVTHGTWISNQRAFEFATLLEAIRELNADLATQNRHPYLFVNSVNAEYQGDPLKISNVEKAFDRACWRAGIVPHTPGASLHGMRHFYKWYAEKILGLSEGDIQQMLRQLSPLSQRAYGKRASDTYDVMTKITESREKSV